MSTPSNIGLPRLPATYSNFPTNIVNLVTQFTPFESNVSRNALFDNNMKKDEIKSWLLRIGVEEKEITLLSDNQVSFLNILKSTDNGTQFFDVKKFQELIGQGLNYKPIINFLINKYFQTADLLSCFLLPSSSCCERKNMLLNMIINKCRETDFDLKDIPNFNGTSSNIGLFNKDMIGFFFDDEKVMESIGIDIRYIPLMKNGFFLTDTRVALFSIYLQKNKLIDKNKNWTPDERILKYFGEEGNNTISYIYKPIGKKDNKFNKAKLQAYTLYKKENKIASRYVSTIFHKNSSILFNKSYIISNMISHYIANFIEINDKSSSWTGNLTDLDKNMLILHKYFKSLIEQMFEEQNYLNGILWMIKNGLEYKNGNFMSGNQVVIPV